MIGNVFYFIIIYFECAVCISHSIFDWVQCVVCRVCVHWGRGMWVEQILKMESFFVGAVLKLWKHTLSPIKPFTHWVAYPSHLGNKQVNHCGATASVHRDCSSLPCHLIFLLDMCLTKSAQLCLPTGCFSCSFFFIFFLIRYVFNTLLVHLLGTRSILLDSVLRFSH